MPDKFFLSATGTDLASDASRARVLWSGHCAVAEYAFEEPASLPRWTLPEESDVLILDDRVVYRDVVTGATGELRWIWPQHLRVQPGSRDTGRSAEVTQVQLVCATRAGTFPALVFAGGELATVRDADRLANVLRQAIARFRVEHAADLGVSAPHFRMLSRLVIGPEFNNRQGGAGQTITLLGAHPVEPPTTPRRTPVYGAPPEPFYGDTYPDAAHYPAGSHAYAPDPPAQGYGPDRAPPPASGSGAPSAYAASGSVPQTSAPSAYVPQGYAPPPVPPAEPAPTAPTFSPLTGRLSANGSSALHPLTSNPAPNGGLPTHTPAPGTAAASGSAMPGSPAKVPPAPRAAGSVSPAFGPPSALPPADGLLPADLPIRTRRAADPVSPGARPPDGAPANRAGWRMTARPQSASPPPQSGPTPGWRMAGRPEFGTPPPQTLRPGFDPNTADRPGRPADDASLRGTPDLASRAAELAARVASLVSAEALEPDEPRTTNLSAYLAGSPPPASQPTGARAEQVRRTAARLASNSARTRAITPRRSLEEDATAPIPGPHNA